MMDIRLERSGDVAGIRAVTRAAFAPESGETPPEVAMVDALRADRALSLSVVAEREGEIAGHAAVSPVRVEGRNQGWFGLGPVSVRPDLQRRGIGSALIRDALRRLETLDAAGCVVLGDPAFYTRFGFEANVELVLEGYPAAYFMALPLKSKGATGRVTYHPALGDG